jgi:hypothetical protein
MQHLLLCLLLLAILDEGTFAVRCSFVAILKTIVQIWSVEVKLLLEKSTQIFYTICEAMSPYTPYSEAFLNLAAYNRATRPRYWALPGIASCSGRNVSLVKYSIKGDSTGLSHDPFGGCSWHRRRDRFASATATYKVLNESYIPIFIFFIGPIKSNKGDDSNTFKLALLDGGRH